MGHLWVRDKDDWSILPLEASVSLVTMLTMPPTRASRPHDVGSQVVILAAGPRTWVLLAAGRVRVNGVPVASGIRVLADRDEIHVLDVGTSFFSTESLVQVELFPGSAGSAGSERRTHCPRCKQDVAKETPAVKCPQCNVWYHESAELPCWTYAPRCAACSQETALDAGYRWTPQGLE